MSLIQKKLNFLKKEFKIKQDGLLRDNCFEVANIEIALFYL